MGVLLPSTPPWFRRLPEYRPGRGDWCAPVATRGVSARYDAPGRLTAKPHRRVWSRPDPGGDARQLHVLLVATVLESRPPRGCLIDPRLQRAPLCDAPQHKTLWPLQLANESALPEKCFRTTPLNIFVSRTKQSPPPPDYYAAPRRIIAPYRHVTTTTLKKTALSRLRWSGCALPIVLLCLSRPRVRGCGGVGFPASTAGHAPTSPLPLYRFVELQVGMEVPA